MASIRAAIFDLDGTLLDSHADLAAALATALAGAGLPAPSATALRAMVGAGARALVERAVAGRADVEPVLAGFRAAYRARPLVETRLYAGLAPALDALTARGLTFAVVSNKPHELTTYLVAQLLAAWPFAAVYGHRPELPLKPDPTSTLCAADELGVAPAQCAFIGDSAIDVATARAAGMRAVAVTWGFRDRGELLAAGPDAVVDAPAELPAAIVA
ncbi:MAG: HAD family hydrolase [Kofleriaceae bacterium]